MVRRIKVSVYFYEPYYIYITGMVKTEGCPITYVVYKLINGSIEREMKALQDRKRLALAILK